MSILNMLDDDVVESKPGKKKKQKVGLWGTPEEQYRRLCMLVLLCRYTYYYHSVSVVDDHTYDLLEQTVKDIEEKHRELIHPNSPSFCVGSEREGDYPRSVRILWSVNHDDPSTWECVGKAIVSFMEDAREEFGV